MVLAGEAGGCSDSIEGENDVEPALRVLIEVTAGVSNLRAVSAGASVDCRGVAVERVQGDDTHDGISRRTEDAENIVCRLKDKAISSAEPLIGRLDGELISTVGEALLVEVEAVDAEVHYRIRLGVMLARHRCAAALGAMSDGAVNRDRAGGILAAIVSVGTGDCGIKFRTAAGVHSDGRGAE